jgi:hypothetical protein
MAGPDEFPDHLLPFPEVEIYNEGAGGPPRQLMVMSVNGQPFHNALVALYTTPYSYTVAIDQGLTDRNGQITIFGALEGDTVQAASFDGAFAGAVKVDTSTTYILTLSSTASSSTHMQSVINNSTSYLNLIPGSEGDTLLLEVHDASASSLPLNAVVIPGEGGGSPQSTSLVYTSEEDAYIGQISLQGVGLGSGEVRVSGVAGGQWISINSDYNLMHVKDNQANELNSEDGNLQLYIDKGSLLNHADTYVVVLPTGYVPGPPSEEMKVMGSAYEIRSSGATTGLTKPGLLRMFYHPEVMGTVNDLAIYYWNAVMGQWERLSGVRFEIDHSVSVKVDQFGVYALMGVSTDTLRSVFLPNVMR